MPQDAELIAMTRGDSGAFADLYQKYRARLHQYAQSLIRSRMKAEDVVNDVLVAFAKQASDGRVPRQLSANLNRALLALPVEPGSILCGTRAAAGALGPEAS